MSTLAINKKQWVRRIVMLVMLPVLAIIFMAMQAGRADAAVPAATSIISNQATAQYTDATLVVRNTASNTVQTTVSQVKSFTLTAPGMKTSPIGQQVCYAHTISNTGNGPDTYALVAPVPSGSFNHTGLTYYLDSGGGVPTGSAITTSGLINAGTNFQFVVCGNVPVGPVNGATGTITVRVSDTTAASITTPTTNADVTTVSGSAIQVTKDLVATPPNGAIVTSGPSPSVQLYVVLRYTNNGSLPATNLLLTDALPTNMVYGAAGLARWSGAPATPLTEAVGEVAVGITYGVSGSTVTATIANVANGQSGHVYFPVTIAAGVAPSTITNTATYSTTENPTPSTTNPASYTVAQTAAVVANNTTGSPANGVPDNTVTPLNVVGGSAVTAASPGQTIVFENVIWNTGNATDSFTINLLNNTSCAPGNVGANACTFPAGTTFAMYQADGIQSLPGAGANMTGNLNPGAYYVVVVKATLPAGATSGNNGGSGFKIDKQATSNFDPSKVDIVTDRLAAITAISADITNNSQRCDSTPTAGTASDGSGAAPCNVNTVATTGFGPGTASVIVTNTVTPSTSAPTTTVFRLYVNNTSLSTDTYSLTASAAPAGWSSVFHFDGGAGNCSTLGAATVNSGSIAANGNKLICAVVTVPSTSTGNAPTGTTSFTYSITSNLVPSVTDSIVDAVTVNAVHQVVITPNGMGQTVPGGSLTYTHTVSNNGNVSEPIAFIAPFLVDNQPVWSSTLYWDTNSNGVLDGADTVITASTLASPTFTLTAAGSATSTKNIFVVVQSPGTASSLSPPNVTTITATYYIVGTTAQANDTTTVSDGLLIEKYQQTTSCSGGAPSATLTLGVPSAPWTKNAIPASAATAPGQCLAYLIVATNKTAGPISAITVNDTLPSMSPVIVIHTGCGAPSATAPGTAPTGPNTDGATGTISTGAATLSSGQSFALQFCVKINDT